MVWSWLSWLLTVALAIAAFGHSQSDAQAALPPAVDARINASDEASVVAAHVSLEIWRGGELAPSGASVPRRGAWVEGEVRYSLAAPAVAGQVLRLLDFAAFLREDPIELDEVALANYIDGPFSAAQTTIVDYEGATTVRRVSDRLDIELGLLPGATAVTLRYTVFVPARYWPLGCVRRRCSLSGAIAPLPSAPATGGRYLPGTDRVVTPARWTVERATMAKPREVSPMRLGTAWAAEPEVIVGGGDGSLTEYPMVLWGPHWYRTSQSRSGVTVDVYHARKRPGTHAPGEPFTQLRRDVVGRVQSVALELIDVVTALGGTPAPVGTHLVAVQGPLRSDVAQAHPGMVLVSDEAYEVFPAKRIVKFHDEAVARATADALMLGVVRGQQDASTTLWLSGSLSFAALDLWRAARSHRDEFASDLLRNLTFVPAVDRFLYTQQASFSQSYFRGVEDDPPLRNHPLWFSHELPTGRRIHEKLADTVGPKALRTFDRTMISHPGARPRRVAERSWGHTLDWFFDQWLGPYPEVDYLLARVNTTKLGPGAGANFEHQIVVRKIARDVVVEPVQVLVTERGGRAHYLVWNGELNPPGGPADNSGEDTGDEPETGTHTFVLRTEARIKSVRLDPRFRLVQTPIQPANVDPRFNDRRPAQFRFLYTGAGLSIAASEFVNAATPSARFNAVAGFASFEASLRRDLRRTGHVLVARDRESVISVGSGVNFWFGGKSNRQRRRARLRVFYTAALLSSRSLDERGGVRMVETLALIDDTRKFAWWPERGRSLAAGLSARQVLRTGDTAVDDDRHDLAASAEWVQLWPLAHNHVLASLVRGELVLPLVRAPEFRALSRVGGIGGLSGYAADEVFGLGVVTAQAEYRHVFFGNMHANIAHIGYVRGVGGVLFAGAATTSGCDNFGGWFGADSWYGHVGYGITSRLAILGVTPQLLRLEASIPLVRREGVRCLDRVLPDFLAERQGLRDASQLLPPFNINLTFNHTF